MSDDFDDSQVSEEEGKWAKKKAYLDYKWEGESDESCPTTPSSWVGAEDAEDVEPLEPLEMVVPFGKETHKGQGKDTPNKQGNKGGQERQEGQRGQGRQ